MSEGSKSEGRGHQYSIEEDAETGDYLRGELRRRGYPEDEIKRLVFRSGQEYAATLFQEGGAKQTMRKHADDFLEKLDQSKKDTK